MMNSVPAGVAGTIVEVCAENAQLVEDGAPLFHVRPIGERRAHRQARRHRRHDDPRRQPEPVERHGPDDRRHPWRSPRRWIASASTRWTSRRARTWPCAVRFHHEDPWERLRLVSAAMPSTPLSFITSGMRFITWVPVDEDVMRLAFRCVVRNGIRRVPGGGPRPTIPAACGGGRGRARGGRRGDRDRRSRTRSARCTRTPTTPSAPPRWPTARRWTGSISKDPGGLVTVDAVRELAPALPARGRRATDRAPQSLHDRARSVRLHGGSPRRASRSLHTAVEPLARGTSNPAAGDDAPQPRGRGVLASARPGRSRRRLGALPRARSREGLPLGQPQEYDATYYHHQLAGGMVSTTRRMLEELRRPELFGAVLEEVGRVRAEMGYPIIVTPVSQQVATQAVQERHRRRALVERLRRDDPLLPRPLRRAARTRGRRRRRARAVAARVPQSSRARAAAPRRRARARSGARISDEELLLRLTMPEEQVDAIRPFERRVAARGSRCQSVPSTIRWRRR
mgnify:CR=1 FL=1